MATATTNRLSGGNGSVATAEETAKATETVKTEETVKAKKGEGLALSALKEAKVTGKITVAGGRTASVNQPLAEVTGFTQEAVLRDMQNPLNDKGTITVETDVKGADGKAHKIKAKVSALTMAQAFADMLKVNLPSLPSRE